jgi:lipid A 4'-phosphatase
MQYLKLRRSRAILASLATSSLFFTLLPRIDIDISRLFFHKSFYLRQQWWTTLMHESMGYFLGLSIAAVLALYIWNKLSKQNLFEVDGKRVVYLFLVLIVGAGLIVNVALKDHFGRARPRDIAEFGGSMHYTPPFVISDQCGQNCSFASGEAAGGFFAAALALALSRRRSMLAAGVGFGALVSFCRIASGAHFLSDTVVSFFVMLIVADVLHYYLVLTETEREATPPMTPQAAADLRNAGEA